VAAKNMKKLPLFFLLTLLINCSSNPENTIIIGSKFDTEGAILGYIQLLALENAGLKVEDRIETGPTLIVRRALLFGELDGYIEYTGTALVNFMGETSRDIISDPQKAYREVREWDLEQHRIIWLDPWSGINNTYTVLMRREQAEQLNLRTISGLAVYLRNGGIINFGSDPEFAAREDGLPGLQDAYGFRDHPDFRVRQMDAGLVYQTLKQGSIDAAIGYSTDGRIAAFDLVRLEDDRQFFPVYNPTPTYRQETLKSFPRVADILNRIAAAITAAHITEMNYRHDVQLVRPRILAEEWLKKNGFLP
jgi:osmoprotectant transport system substrate-binding protein